jgi:hypothetical protein
VVIADTSGLGALQCTAPSGPGFGDVQLRVSVAGGGNVSVPFLYTAPAITGLSVVACAAEINQMIQVFGTNLGSFTGTSPKPVVYIGGNVCDQLSLLDENKIQCRAVASEVGAYPVVGTCSSFRPQVPYMSRAVPITMVPSPVSSPFGSSWGLCF